jgi:hypothetical protein
MSKTSRAIHKTICKTTITQPKTSKSTISNMARCNKTPTRMKIIKLCKLKFFQINMSTLEILETKTPWHSTINKILVLLISMEAKV